MTINPNQEAQALTAGTLNDLEAARHHARQGDHARDRNRATLRAVEPLFGRAVYLSLSESVESLEEHAGEAAHHYERHVAHLEARGAVHLSEIASLRAEVQDLRAALAFRLEQTQRLADELAARFRRGGAEVPEWIDALTTPTEEVPF